MKKLRERIRKNKKSSVLLLLLLFFLTLLILCCCFSLIFTFANQQGEVVIEPESSAPVNIVDKPKRKYKPTPEPTATPEPTQTPVPTKTVSSTPVPTEEPYCSPNNIKTYWENNSAASFTWESFTTNGFSPYYVQGFNGPGHCWVKIAEPEGCVIAGWLTGGNTVTLSSSGEYLATDPSFGCNATKN